MSNNDTELVTVYIAGTVCVYDDHRWTAGDVYMTREAAEAASQTEVDKILSLINEERPEDLQYDGGDFYVSVQERKLYGNLSLEEE